MSQTIVPSRHRSKKGVVTYRVRFRFGGIERTKSLGQVRKSDADVMAAKIARALNDIEAGLLEIPQSIDAMDFIMSGGESKQLRKSSGQTLASLRDAYLDAQKLSVASSTVEEYRTRLKAVCSFLGESKLLDEISFRDLERFVKHRQKTVSGNTARRDVTRFFDAYKLAIAKGWVTPDRRMIREQVLDNLQFKKSRKKPKFRTLTETLAFIEKRKPDEDELEAIWRRCYLGEDELAKFIKAIETAACADWIRVMVLTAIYTGARRQELCDIRLKDVDEDEGVLLISQRKAHHKQHSGSEREVPINAQLKPILSKWIEEHPGCSTLFYEDGSLSRSRSKTSGVRPVTHDIATDRLRRVVSKMTEFKSIAGRWHIFRHSFISLCAVKGVSKGQVKEWVGHLSDEISEHYTHLSKKHAEEAMSKVSL